MVTTKIHFEKTWCDYLTPCPFNKSGLDNVPIMVGEYDCMQCPYCAGIDNNDKVVLCKNIKIV